jgi:hypothetical protein
MMKFLCSEMVETITTNVAEEFAAVTEVLVEEVVAASEAVTEVIETATAEISSGNFDIKNIIKRDAQNV